MSLFRTFIAVDVSPEVRARAVKLERDLQQSRVKASWTSGESMHLTLKFLGDTPDGRLPDVCRAVQRAAAPLAPIQLAFKQAGAFPRMQRPRTVWIGLETGREPLERLQIAIEDALYDEGFPRERRRFVPHLTIARVRAGGPALAALSARLERHADFDAGSTLADEVVVYASFLDGGGPTYQVVGRAELGG